MLLDELNEKNVIGGVIGLISPLGDHWLNDGIPRFLVSIRFADGRPAQC